MQGASPQAVDSAPDLLQQARERINKGRVPDDIRRAIVASPHPQHARAGRLLRALEAETQDAVAGGGDASAPTVSVVSPDSPAVAPVSIPPVATGHDDAAAATDPAVATDKAAASAPASERKGGSSSGPALPWVSSLALAKGGATVTLTVAGSGPLDVGMVQSAASGGWVRLVVSGRPGAGLLNDRPRVAGVEVLDVQPGAGSVLVKLQLEPGWQAGDVDDFRGGARIRFHGPKDQR